MLRALALALLLALLPSGGRSQLVDADANIPASVAGQTIAGIAISGTTFAAGSPSGTNIGFLTVSMNPASPAFTGSLALSQSGGCNSTTGADNTKFQIVSGELATLTAGLSLPTYNVCVAASQGGISNSPVGVAFIITTTGGSCTPAPRLAQLPQTFSMGVVQNGGFGSPGDGWLWAHNAGVAQNVGWMYVNYNWLTGSTLNVAQALSTAQSYNNFVPIFDWYITGSNQYQFQSTTFMNNNGSGTGYWQQWQNFLTQIQNYHNAHPTSKYPAIDIEPDAFGQAEQVVGASLNMANFAARVGNSGYTGVAGFASLPNNLAGVAQGLVAIRNTYAPNVPIGYHTAFWASSNTHFFDPVLAPSAPAAAASASDISTWVNSGGVTWDLIFYDVSDSTSGYNQIVCGSSHTLRLAWGVSNNGEAGPAGVNNFNAYAQWVSDIYGHLHLNSFVWQVPIGNSVMKAMDNDLNNNGFYTCSGDCPALGGHFQDDRVQYLVQNGNPNLAPLVNAHVLGLLFAGGQYPGLGFCQNPGFVQNNKGDTQIGHWLANSSPYNPAPIGLSNSNYAGTYPGNTTNDGVATTTDDDGGFLRTRLTAYFAGSQPAVCPN